MQKSNVSVLDLMCKDKYAEANNHKRARDELTNESKMWIIRRNDYNERAKRSSEEANALRKERDTFNAKVKDLKEKRNACQAKAAELKDIKGPEYDRLREEANSYHNEMVECHEKGQQIHERMSKLFDDADGSRKAANAAHNRSIECRKKADEEHKLYVAALESVKNLKDDIPDFDLE